VVSMDSPLRASALIPRARQCTGAAWCEHALGWRSMPKPAPVAREKRVVGWNPAPGVNKIKGREMLEALGWLAAIAIAMWLVNNMRDEGCE